MLPASAPDLPVDVKRGRPPDNPERAWEPERVQLCVQGLLLREAGYRCERGVLYFASARERVTVEFDDALVARTLELVGELREVAGRELPPPPLVDSPKCPRCSLVGICLPDEVNTLVERSDRPPRRLTPPNLCQGRFHCGQTALLMLKVTLAVLPVGYVAGSIAASSISSRGTLRRVTAKTSVYLGPEEFRLLANLERRTGRSRSQLLRDGIHALADRLPARPRPRSVGIAHLAPGTTGGRWDADGLARRRGLDA